MTRRLTEKQLQNAVLEMAKRLGWRTAHFGNTVKIVKRGAGYKTIPDKAAAGFPDLVMVRPPRIIFVELKDHSGQLSDLQTEWIQDLMRCAKEGVEEVEAYIWRPNDWESGIIERRLR